MDNWRPDGIVVMQPDRVLGVYSFSSVSIKDRSLLVPLVMLNACLTFSWLNNVPSDHKARNTIWPRINSGWQVGAEEGKTGA
jgi:hypothetical protein